MFFSNPSSYISPFQRQTLSLPSSVTLHAGAVVVLEVGIDSEIKQDLEILKPSKCL